jgi:hypothetical protein
MVVGGERGCRWVGLFLGVFLGMLLTKEHVVALHAFSIKLMGWNLQPIAAHTN